MFYNILNNNKKYESLYPILSPGDLDSCWNLDADQGIFSKGFQLLNVVGSLALIFKVLLQ